MTRQWVTELGLESRPVGFTTLPWSRKDLRRCVWSVLHEKFFLVSSALASCFSLTSYRVPVSTIRKTVAGLEYSRLSNGKILARVIHTLILQIINIFE